MRRAAWRQRVTGWWKRATGGAEWDAIEPIALEEEADTLLRLLSIQQQSLSEIRQKMQGITYRTITLYAVFMGLALNTTGTFTWGIAAPLVIAALAALYYLKKQQDNYIRVYTVVQRIDQRLGCHRQGHFGHEGSLYDPDWNKVHASWWWAMKAHVFGVVGFCLIATLVAIYRNCFLIATNTG